MMKRETENRIRVEIFSDFKNTPELALLINGINTGILDAEVGDDFDGAALYYATEGYDTLYATLRSVPETGKAYFKSMRQSIIQIFKSLSSVRNSFLYTSKIVMNPEKIFICKSTGNVGLIYDPGSRVQNHDLMPVSVITAILGTDLKFEERETLFLMELRQSLVGVECYEAAVKVIENMKNIKYDSKEKQVVETNEFARDREKSVLTVLSKHIPPSTRCVEDGTKFTHKFSKKDRALTSAFVMLSLIAVTAGIVTDRILILDGIGFFIVVAGCVGIYIAVKKKSTDTVEKDAKIRMCERVDTKVDVKKLIPDIFEKTQVSDIKSAITLKAQSVEVDDMLISKSYSKVGRIKSTSDIFISSKLVGRNHAEIFIQDGEIFIRDLNTLNGTFINNKRVPSNSKIRVKVGDLVKFATFEFKVDRID